MRDRMAASSLGWGPDRLSEALGKLRKASVAGLGEAEVIAMLVSGLSFTGDPRSGYAPASPTPNLERGDREILISPLRMGERRE